MDVDKDPYNPAPRHVSHPKCALCLKRYMALTCAQCHESYCVDCSSHIHSKPAREHHQVMQYHHVYIKPKQEVSERTSGNGNSHPLPLLNPLKSFGSLASPLLH